MIALFRKANVVDKSAWLIAAAGLIVGVNLSTIACFTPPGAAEPLILPGGPEYSVIMVSSDLAMGANRVAFGLVDRDNRPVSAADVQVRPIYTPPGNSPALEGPTVKARFLSWPPEGSDRGVFIAPIDFETPGEATTANPGLWELRVTATQDDGTSIQAATAVRVAAFTATPDIGVQAPRSVTPTVDSTDDLTTITSSPDPDPELYRLSLHEALESGKPTVALFSTPAFCVSATCGPQLDILGQLKARYRDQANFIHIEVFADPHLIQGNRLSARRVPAVEEWGLPTEPWTFVMDGEGRVRAKFEQFTPEWEIEAALKEAL